MSQSKVVQYHLWYLDGRSLCDRRSLTESRRVAEADEVTVCGPCVIAAELLHAEMKALVRQHGEPTPSPQRSAGQLARDGSRWSRTFDLEALRTELRETRYEYPQFYTHDEEK